MADITTNGLWYEVHTHHGERWTFDKEDADIAYIDNALEAWAAWRAFVATGGDWK